MHQKSSLQYCAKNPQNLTKVSKKFFDLIQDDGLADRRSQVTPAMCQAVRAGLTESELSEANDEMINQFLRATKLDIDKATKRLKATIAWRLKEQPHKRVCQMCNKTPGSHWLQVVRTFCLWHHDLLFWSFPFWLCLWHHDSFLWRYTLLWR